MRYSKVLFLSVFLMICAGMLFGQADTGVLTGTVTDMSGAVVPSAKVTVVSVNTNLTRSATTNSSGEYTITSLKPDSYLLTIEASGFAPYKTRVTVQVGAKMEASAKLDVGTKSTTVEVTASGESVAVNTESQTLSMVVDQNQMENLPTLTRNAYDLVGTSGNVAEDSNSNRGAGFSINGQRSASTNILLDGAENVDLFTATVGQAVPLDSVQEFRVITSNFTAEYGRASGGVVNVATKSGTNKITGSVYEFNRVSAVSSNTYDNVAKGIDKPRFVRNQFGYALGGPVVKNKMFAFSSTEWTRVRSNGTQTASVLDPAFLALPGVANSTKAFMNAFGTLRSDAAVTQHVTLGQALNQTGTCDGLPCTSPFGMQVVYNTPSDAGGGTPQNTWNTVLRYDYNVSDKTTFFARYAAFHEYDFAGSLTNSPYVGYDTPNKNLNQNVALNLTHVFNPNFISSSKISYNRLNNMQPLAEQPVAPTLYTSNLGLPNLRTTNGAMVFPGYSAFTPGNAIPFGGPQNLLQFYEDISINKGNHQFKFGGSYINTHDNRMFGAYESAVESLSTTASLTPAIANLISGNIAQFQGAAYPQGKYPCFRDLTTGALIATPACTVTLPVSSPSFSRNFQYNDGAFYAQDGWKFKPRLTINYGIRWEYFGVQHNADPGLDANFYLGTGANRFEQVRNGTVQIANQSPVGGLWAPQKQNWAPRIGFAWDVFGNGKTSLRGGYGISFERNFNNVTYNIIQNPPNYAVISLVAGSDIASMPIYTDNFGPLAGTGTKALPAASLRAVDPHMKTAYAQFWSGSIDREVFKNALLSVEYSASKGSRLYSIANYNVSYFGSTFLGDARAANRLNQQYSNINWRGSDGWSYYHGMNVKFAANNMFNKGLSLNANYTWSHAMDNLSSAFSDGTPGNFVLGYTNAYFPSLDNGNADFDVRHRFVLSGIWEVPWGNKASNTIARTLLGGWSFSPIVNIRTGFPYSVWDCYNGVYNCPRWAPGQSVSLKGTRGDSVGTNLFSWLPLPLDSTGSPVGMGNSSDVPTCTGLAGAGCSFTTIGGYPERNQFVGPNYWTTNMVIGKNFKLTERFNLQFRAEMYNMFNHHNDYIQGGSNDASSITEVTSSKGGYGNASDERRNVQFGLKLNF